MAPSRIRERRKSWGQRVEARRLEVGLSQGQVGRIAGLPQQTVSRVELDKHVPRYTTMESIAKALGTSVEELFPMESHPGHQSRAS